MSKGILSNKLTLLWWKNFLIDHSKKAKAEAALN
jgi:hypothetical protein